MVEANSHLPLHLSPRCYQRQQGAALLVVMVFLAISLTIALSSMNSSLVNERLAGNYRLMTLAQMAAENGGSAELEDEIDHDIYTDCRILARQAREDIETVDWETGKDLNSNSSIPLGYQKAPCQHDGDDALLIMGIANHENPITSNSLIIVGMSHTESDLPLGNYGGTVTAAGAARIPTLNPGNASHIENGLHYNLGITNVPDPRDLAGDDSTTGYIANIQRRANADDPAVYSSCNINGNIPSGVTHVFCLGNYTGNLSSALDGLTIVATDSFGTSEDEKKNFLKINSDVNASLVAGDTISIKGFGNNTLRGFLWSGGSIHISGRSNIIGGVVANGAVTFDGKTYITGGNQDDDSSTGNIFWEPI